MADVPICEKHCGRSLTIISENLKVLSSLEYFWRKIMNKQKHKILSISVPKVTNKKILCNFLTNFIMNKLIKVSSKSAEAYLRKRDRKKN